MYAGTAVLFYPKSGFGETKYKAFFETQAWMQLCSACDGSDSRHTELQADVHASIAHQHNLQCKKKITKVLLQLKVSRTGTVLVWQLGIYKAWLETCGKQ